MKAPVTTRSFVVAMISLGLAAFVSASEPSRACNTCINGVRILDDLLCDPSAVDAVVEFMDTRLCPRMSQPSKCHNLAQGLLPMLIQWLRSAAPSGLCSAAGMCGATLAASPFYAAKVPARRVGDDMQCALCKFVLEEVKESINETAVLDKVKEQALEACKELPAQFESSCTQMVTQYAPLIEMLVESMTADEACELMGLCSEALKKRTVPPLPHQLLPALQALHRIDANSPSDALLPSPNGCQYCKLAVMEMHTLVSDPEIQQSMVTYVESLCTNFPSIADDCKIYVDEYSMLVFSLLEQYLDPESLCAQTGMCPAARPAGPLAVLKAALVQLLGVGREPAAMAGVFPAHTARRLQA